MYQSDLRCSIFYQAKHFSVPSNQQHLCESISNSLRSIQGYAQKCESNVPSLILPRHGARSSSFNKQTRFTVAVSNTIISPACWKNNRFCKIEISLSPHRHRYMSVSASAFQTGNLQGPVIAVVIRLNPICKWRIEK